MSKRGKRQHRAIKRREALREAATSVSAAQDVAPAAAPAVASAVAPAAQAPAAPPQRRRRVVPLAIAGVGAALALAMSLALILRQPVDESAQIASPTIAVGVPGGEVIAQATPMPTNSPSVTPEPTVASTPVPATAAPTPAATPAPQPTPAPAPTSAPPPPSATPAPTAVVVAVAGPDDAVAAFYRNVAAGNFDAAYSLWSARMKAAYPRQENLDGRFAETESIEFQQLFVAEQTERTATVQANFTEFFEDGGSREFVGYWLLVFVDGRWLLEEPHY